MMVIRKGVLKFIVLTVATLSMSTHANDIVLNGNVLSSTEAHWVKYVAQKVLPELSGDRSQQLRTASIVSWWGLKEGIFQKSNPHAFSNCSPGEQKISVLSTCGSGEAWQIGLSGIQVAWNDPSKVLQDKYPSQADKQEVLRRVAQSLDFSEGSPEFNQVLESQDYLRRSMFLRYPPLAFEIQRGVVERECIQGEEGWCFGSSWDRTAKYAPTKESALQSIDDLARVLEQLSQGLDGESNEELLVPSHCDGDPERIGRLLNKLRPIMAEPLVPLPVSTTAEWLGRDKFLDSAKRLYADAQDFQLLSIKANLAAQRCLDAGKVELACEYHDKMLRYHTVTNSLVKSSIDLYGDAIDIAKSEVIYKSAMAALGATTLYIGPVAAKVLTVGKLATDFYMDEGLGYEGEAETNLAISVVSNLLVASIVPDDMGKRVTNSVGKSGAYEYLQGIVGSSEFKDKAVKYVMSASGRISREAAEEAVNKVSDIVVRFIMEPTPVGDNTVRTDILSALDIPKSICADQHVVSEGTAAALVLDSSGSMKEPTKRADGITVSSRMEVAKEALRAYVSTLDEASYVSVTAFNTQANTQLSMTSGQVSGLAGKLDSVLGAIQPGGATNIGAGLVEGHKQLSSNPFTGSMAILLSDGENNRGSYDEIVQKYADNGWPVCTIGFGTSAGETQLKSIAARTGCTYSYADATTLVKEYQHISAYAKNQEFSLQTSDLIPPDGVVEYPFKVYADSKSLRAFSNWGGSRLRVVLSDPSGQRYGEASGSRFREGNAYQMLEVTNPQPGQWILTADWDEAPPQPEQVNITVTGQSDVFVRAHGLRPHYKVGQPVEIKVDAMEVTNVGKQPLLNAQVRVVVQKPEEELIRMVHAQSSNWTMYKDVVVDVSRDVMMYDDGGHDENAAGDGIFGGVFHETDKNGPYVYTVTITGQHRDGRPAQRTITGSFQVGSILQNPISSSAVMTYKARAANPPAAAPAVDPLSDEAIEDPLEQIENMEGDALENIEDFFK